MADEFEAALATALRRLEASDRFESEVRRALSRHRAETVEQVLDYLRRNRLLNDERTAQNLLDLNQGRRAVGAEGLRATLERRGAPDEIVEEAVAASASDDPQRARELLLTKFASRDPKEMAKAGRFLYSRGFEEDLIRTALEEHFPAADPFGGSD